MVLNLFQNDEIREILHDFEEHNHKIKQYVYMHNIIENYTHNNSYILINRK